MAPNFPKPIFEGPLSPGDFLSSSSSNRKDESWHVFAELVFKFPHACMPYTTPAQIILKMCRDDLEGLALVD